MQGMANWVQGCLGLLYAYLLRIFKLGFAKEEKAMEAANKNISQVYIPSHIVTEILRRLPLKSIARCTTVSKQWYSCISDYHFLDEYRYRNPKFSYILSFDCMNWTPTSLELHLYRLGSNRCTYLRTMKVPNPYTTMLPSSFGLVCLYGNCNGSIAVFNPTSEELISLPDLHEHVIVDDGNFSESRYNEVGFGYDPQSRKYKVVQMVHDSAGTRTLRSCRVLTVTRPRSSRRATDMFLYCKQLINGTSTETHSRSSWREIDIFHDCKELIIGTKVLSQCVDGKLYWVTTQLKLEGPMQLVMFDLSRDDVQVITSPVTPNWGIRGHRSRHLVELQRRLGFVQLASPGASLLMNVSILNYSGCCVTWDHMYSLDFGPCAFGHSYSPLCVMHDRILLFVKRSIYSYDFKKKSFKIYGGSKGKTLHREFGLYASVHVETLVFLN